MSSDENEDARIGVFVCDCGTNIAGVVDVPTIVEFARTLDSVVFAEEGKWICSVDYLTKIKEHIAEHNLTRVVVACCTPRTHEPTFKATLKEAGLNPFLLEFVSIREQSSWVHKDDPELATETAKDLVRMGVAKARLLEPGEELRIPVGKESLVIGGGIGGMTSALALADLGFKVILVEKDTKLGGLLQSLNKVAPEDRSASELIQAKIQQVEAHENISVFTNSMVTDIKGYVGNFKVTVTHNSSDSPTSQHDISTMIVATGMQEIEPTGQFGYGKLPNVITQLQFEELLKNDPNKMADVKNIAFINCVNSRTEERGCCNVGCLSSIKNIKYLKASDPKINAYLFFRDLNITGTDVQYHYNSMDKYAAAFRYPDTNPPQVTPLDNSRLSIRSYDILSGSQVKVETDLLVLVTGYRGNSSNEHLKGLLKVSTNRDGFFQEAHVKLRPLDFANEGIYICGCARSPKSIHETLNESLGAAMRAAIPMNRAYVETEGIVASVNPEQCVSCGICSEVCAYGAAGLIEHESNIIQAICKGCGTCVSSCPEDAISMVHYSDPEIQAQVDAALVEKPEKKIITFACHWCALGAVDNAGVSRFQYPANIRVIRVMCSGRVDPSFILRAFEHGSAGVMVAGCEFPTCHYISGNYYAAKKILLTRKLLELAGIDPGRLRFEWLSAAEGAKFATVSTEFTNQMDELGPLTNDNFTELDMQAAIKCSESDRLRILSSKLKDFVEGGNRYNEVFTDHEVERLINEMVYDEFINQKILLILEEASSSMGKLSEKMNIDPNRIFKNILALKQAGRLKVDRLDGTTPYYSVIPESSGKTTQDPVLDTGAEPGGLSPNEPQKSETEFDHTIIGTTMMGLTEALKLAAEGKKICLISKSAGFIDNPPVLSKGFTGFSKYIDYFKGLVEQVHKNENITILKNSDIEKIDKQDTGTKLELHIKSVYVDGSKCDNCGKCVEVCPVNLIDLDAHGLGNKHAIYQPSPKSDSVKFAISKAIPYCQASCPIAMDARGYIGNIAAGDIDGASSVIRNTNPLPDICGKVCDHKCESTCVRGFLDEPLEIRKLKRFAMETQYEQFEKDDRPILSKPTAVKNRDAANKVAIIGSGPAGLAAAHDLARLGYPVTIFEAASEPGGMLRLGILGYRLPPGALNKEINAILDLGVELKLNTPLGPGLSLNDLRAQGFKVLFLGVGAHKSLKLRIEGEALDGVRNGLEFLKECNLGPGDEKIMVGQNIAIIGGGNVAMDCARSAKRLGAKNVNILYRRSKSEMPAEPEELEQCIEEGINVEYLVAPTRILGSEKVESIECQRNELGAPDASGRRRPVPIEGSEFTMEIDTVLTAIGQAPDLNFITEQDDLELTPRSTFIIDEKTGATNLNGVFAGGDAVTGPTTVISAIKTGKTAALGIDQFLSGDLNNNPNVCEFKGEKRTSEMELLQYRKNFLLLQPESEKGRQAKKLLDPSERTTNFNEVELPFTAEEATQEATRCLSCRMCIGCGVCQAVCPKDAIDYTMPDEFITIESKDESYFPELKEGRSFENEKMKELYKNSQNVLSPMELEYMLIPGGSFDGQILRPSDGEVPKNIAFIYLAQQEFVTDKDAKFNDLELEYMLKLIGLIKNDHPEVNISLFTNTAEVTNLPKEFQYLKENLVGLDDLKYTAEIFTGDTFEVNGFENNTFEISNNSEKYFFDLLVIAGGLSVD